MLAEAGAPTIIGSVGLDVVGPSLVDHGTEAQKRRFLEPILSADDIWCQGFSEVGAGSDLAVAEDPGASSATAASSISGHKVWTSYAHHAQWCAVLARTDPDAPAHKGISYLLVDMTSPGIEIRPLVQSTGDPEFGEVYFDDVEVPAENLLGPLHGGWRIAMHTLTHERGWYGVGRQVILRVLLDRLIEEARHAAPRRSAGDRGPGDPLALAQAHIGLEVAQAPGLPERRQDARRRPARGSRARSTRSSWLGSSSGCWTCALDVLGAAGRARRRPRRPAPTRRVWHARLLLRPRRLGLRRHRADPEEHHRRAHPRPSRRADRWTSS